MDKPAEKRRGRPPKYATEEERKQAQLEQIKKYQLDNLEKKNTNVKYLGYNKKELCNDKDKLIFKENLNVYLRFRAMFNFLYEKYPERIDEIFSDKEELIVKK